MDELLNSIEKAKKNIKDKHYLKIMECLGKFNTQTKQKWHKISIITIGVEWCNPNYCFYTSPKIIHLQQKIDEIDEKYYKDFTHMCSGNMRELLEQSNRELLNEFTNHSVIKEFSDDDEDDCEFFEQISFLVKVEKI